MFIYLYFNFIGRVQNVRKIDEKKCFYGAFRCVMNYALMKIRYHNLQFTINDNDAYEVNSGRFVQINSYMKWVFLYTSSIIDLCLI